MTPDRSQVPKFPGSARPDTSLAAFPTGNLKIIHSPSLSSAPWQPHPHLGPHTDPAGSAPAHRKPERGQHTLWDRRSKTWVSSTVTLWINQKTNKCKLLWHKCLTAFWPQYAGTCSACASTFTADAVLVFAFFPYILSVLFTHIFVAYCISG